MHPLLTRFRNLGLYLLAWIPLAAMLCYLLKASAGMGWYEAAALSFPLCAVYAFVCLSAWYPCRATPLETSSVSRLVLTHLTAAIIFSVLWGVGAEQLSALLSRREWFPGMHERLSTHFSMLWTTGVLLYILSVTFYYVLLAEQAAREAQARALQALLLARDAELKALRAQVNPHFLFNCLHSISALTTSDPVKGREMCILLADFLRATLRLGGKESITLQEELSLVRGYLAIEKVRFGTRLQMEEDVHEGIADVQIPPLLLQPLVENAIRHGIANLPEGGTIRLGARLREQWVDIAVENNFDPEFPATLKTGVGLENIRQRLQTRYAEQASIMTNAEANRFQVTLCLPAQNSNPGAELRSKA